MPKPSSSKRMSKINPPQSFPSYPDNQMVYYPADPNMMYSPDPYQGMVMDPSQAAPYYYPQQGYAPQGYPIILDPSRQVMDSPKTDKKKPKSKFSLFKSQQKTAETEESKPLKESAVPNLPPIEYQDRNPKTAHQSVNIENKTANLSNTDEGDQDNTPQTASVNAEINEHRSLIDLASGNINVVIRVRPPNALELKNGYSKVIECANDGETLFLNGPDGTSRALTFNRVYDQDSTQEVFFNQSGIKELISRAIEGYSICIFAFGQTGSGKSFTITGPENQMSQASVGIVPRALRYLFEEIIGRESAGPVTLRSSYLEIYNENVYDLLNPKGPSLPIRWNAEKGFFVENLYVIDCEVLDDCLAILEEGLNNRTTASHRLNEHSSRSHSLMTIHLDSEFKDPNDGRVIQRHGKICFVDLAGSERVKESRAQGDTLTETLNINKSLLTLGKCIAALSDPRKRAGHIPYRDSKLTKLLADSLGGHGMALMVACISPALQNITETVKTLRYAQSAKKIKNKPVINLDPREEMMYMLKREIQSLRKENDLLKNAVFSDPRYKDLIDFIAQGKHLADLPEISRGPQGKTNIVFKSTTKELTHSFDNNTAGFDKSFNSTIGDKPKKVSGSFRENSMNSSTLEKYRANRKFTPGLTETKEMVNTWKSARSISRNNSRGRSESRNSARSRSASISTRTSILSRSSVISRSDSTERSFSVVNRPSIKRELSGRFDYKTTPDIKSKLKKNPENINFTRRNSNFHESLNQSGADDISTDEKYNQRRESHLSDAHETNASRKKEMHDIASKKEPKSSKTRQNIPDLYNKETRNIEQTTYNQNVQSDNSETEDESIHAHDKKANSKSSKSEDKLKTIANKTEDKPKKSKSTNKKETINSGKKDKTKSLDDKDKVLNDDRKRTKQSKTTDPIKNHENLPEILKLKKKTMKDMIALDEEIQRMS